MVTWYIFPPLLTAYVSVIVLFGVVHGMMTYRLPEYNDTPSNVTYYLGNRAILQCSVKYLGTLQVIWKKTNVDHALTVGKLVFVSDPDISVDHLPHREEWNLVITNVQSKHAGQYECQISTKEDLKKYVILNVVDEPARKDEAIFISGKKYVEKGEKIVLICNATGDERPPEDIDWFKDGRTIKQDQYKGISITKFRVAETKTLQSHLEIEHSEMEDGGNYICRSSELSITSKTVIVLNGKYGGNPKPRSQDEKYMTQDSTHLAETKPNKRDFQDPRGHGRSNAAKAYSLKDDVTITLFTALLGWSVSL